MKNQYNRNHYYKSQLLLLQQYTNNYLSLHFQKETIDIVHTA